jgi:hypothetical protein
MGLFDGKRIEMDSGRACLWLGTDPGGRSGFVRNSRAGVNMKAGLYPNSAFNTISYTSMAADWALVRED